MTQSNVVSVYADLGYPDAPDMERKAQLVVQLAVELRSRRINRRAGARLLGIEKSQLADILCGRFRQISVEELGRMVRVLEEALPTAPGKTKVRRYTQRQRKRRHVGEYAQTGIDLAITFTQTVDWDVVIDALIEDVHALGLEAAGFGGKSPCLAIEGAVVFCGSRSDAIQAFDQLLIRLRTRSDVESIAASPPWDGWWAIRGGE